MKLNPNAFGLSLGSVSGIAAFVCGFFVWLAPAAVMAFATLWFHTDITGLAASLAHRKQLTANSKLCQKQQQQKQH